MYLARSIGVSILRALYYQKKPLSNAREGRLPAALLTTFFICSASHGLSDPCALGSASEFLFNLEGSGTETFQYVQPQEITQYIRDPYGLFTGTRTVVKSKHRMYSTASLSGLNIKRFILPQLRSSHTM
jgi:hypothetical protein